MKVKNIVYQTSNYSDALLKKEKYESDNPEKYYYIDSYTLGSRTDAQGTLIIMHNYEVYELIEY